MSTTTGKYIRDIYRLWMESPLLREYYDYSHFFNVGLWLEGTRSQLEACENLMEQLLTFLPEKKGTILDVACGMGATTRYLLKYYPPSAVTGINICPDQLRACQENAPGCTFLLMDAAKLEFETNAFDAIICVEAAFHFETRLAFLREAYRVLKPGGRLVLSDSIFDPSQNAWHSFVPERNRVGSLNDYHDTYRRAGFHKIEVVDLTEECWERFRKNLRQWAQERRLLDQRSNYDLLGLIQHLDTYATRQYLLVAGEKL